MLVEYPEPRSYTGQEMVEIFCHGNPLFVETIITNLVAAGARLARPGEFTARAVLNGKMDLLQAESIQSLVEAHTRYQADLVRRQADGPLVPFIRERLEEILQIQAHIEATIDYGEEDVDALERQTLLARMRALLTRFEELQRTATFAAGMKRGFRVLLTGEPNVGKSTLFNRLVRQERAIVTPLPGPTRDLISEMVEIGGLPILLMDSAGVRSTSDLGETMGIEKIYRTLGDVDLVLYLSDDDRRLLPYPQITALPPEKWLSVLTKADTPCENSDVLAVSALTGAGLERLEQELVIRLSSPMQGQAAYLINQRQAACVGAVIEQLGFSCRDYEAGFGEEVLSSYLNTARRHLGELTGETTVEDILDRMFSNFCLGK